MPKVKIYQNHENITLGCVFGAKLSEVLQINHMHISLPCGGQGGCKKCTVNVDGHKVLACKFTIEKDVEVQLNSATNVEIFKTESIKSSKNLGVAVDIGTTNICAALIDLSNGKILQRVETANLQSAFGADVLSRILSSQNSFVQMSAVAKRQILEIKAMFGVSENLPTVVCANSVISHIFAGVSPEKLGVYPFEMSEFFGRKIGEDYIVRCISSFIGGDVVCGILSCNMLENKENSLFIDIGTNTEIVLKFDDEIIAASAPAGPAFEGVGLKNGMNAAAGAIKSAKIIDGEIACETVGGVPAVGICGSGIVDVLAVFRELNLIDENGSINHETDSKYVTIVGDETCLTLDNVVITGEDVRQILLAKGAICAAIDTVLKGEEVEKVYLAGKFGEYLNLMSAVKIGLFPANFLGKVQIVEDAALSGATSLLCNEKFKEKSIEIAEKIEVIDLTSDENFEEKFIENLRF